jgi:hypothetical protein
MALFEAQLIVEPSDYALSNDLARYAGQKDVVDNILDGKATPGQLNGTLADLQFIGAKASNITAAKKSQLSMQGVTWVGSLASGLSYAIIGAVSAVVPLSQPDKEGYARALPAGLVLLGGIFFYLGSLALFGLLVLTRRLRLHRVAVVLWVVIFAFLFIMVALATITAHSLVQRQASRSAYDMFASAIPAYPGAAVVVVRDNATAGGLTAMRGCGESLRSVLAAKGKAVSVYEYLGTSCFPANGTSVPVAECDAQASSVPQFMLGYGAETKMAFYSYYEKSALLTGNEDFYARCYLARVLNSTS